MTGVTNLLSLATRNLRQSGILVAFVAIVAFFAILNPTFLSPGNLTNIVLQYSYILILAIGMVIVIIAGHIDLSVGSVVALTGATAAVLVIRMQLPWWVGVIAALVVGLLVGRVAGVLGGIRGHPGVHRDARRHAALPRPDLHRAGQTSRSRPSAAPTTR